ncbi:unnamed protein product (macronuclear) [Paramecium tetraurelia]|uniref:Protein kinase domain-containing protein n=1 Tax=Paramecium tetraurelia TaxID=5888 RepID=A0C8D2_PARTE|nr:uncharacterized protein GSPATT00036182001 [Paramecium tetraurelia]CAK67049.1 unnamed protein product [Paramecium tetraurelia]|eukprot:XP_001434446.1 hypothetical protein (macronuclear) [Paramecium tetraurelia strain d4-2]
MSNNSPSEIDGFSIHFAEYFGHGAFSYCYKCSNPNYRIPLCVKIISQSPKTNVAFQREIEIVKKLIQVDCPNLVKILHITQREDLCFIFMEYCQQGDFQSVIQKYLKYGKKFQVQEIIQILSQIINGYRELYKLGIMHRDIKPANIFLGNNGDFQLADYGMSKILENPNLEIEQSHAGTPYYAAPQILINGVYSNKCDIYSLGVLIYQLVYSKLPVDSHGMFQFIEALKRTKTHRIVIGGIPKELGGSASEQQLLLNFLRSSLVYEESSRISWNELFIQFPSNDLDIESTKVINRNISSSDQQLQSPVSSQLKEQNDRDSQSTSIDNNNISQPKETQFLRSNSKLQRANQTGEFPQARQQSQDKQIFQPFHSDQLLQNRQDQVGTPVRQIRMQKKHSLCQLQTNVLEKILGFYQAKCTFANQLSNKIENTFKYLQINKQTIFKSNYTIILYLLQLYLYGYQYSCFLNIYTLISKRFDNSLNLQISKELSFVDKKNLDEEIWTFLQCQSDQKDKIIQNYKNYKQLFLIKINQFQEDQKLIKDPNLLEEIKKFNFQDSLGSPQLYYLQFKKMFGEMNLNFDFEMEKDLLEDHTIEFMAFSIKFIKNEESNQNKVQFLMADPQQLAELKGSKQLLLKSIQQYFKG